VWLKERLTGEEVKCVLTGDAEAELGEHQIKEVWQSRRLRVSGTLHFKGIGKLHQVDGVGEKARALMMGGFAGLKPPDAIHVATALLSPGVEEMHTFDGRLLDMDGLLKKASGEPLKICKPGSGAAAPLLEQMNAETPEPEAHPEG
jgi:predicted nucleic acid-binding protein